MITQMLGRTGHGVANQFMITQEDGSRLFQSYQTIIAKIDKHGSVTLDPRWDCSNTTSKYRAQFLGEGTEETRRKIASGEYEIVDLNK